MMKKFIYVLLGVIALGDFAMGQDNVQKQNHPFNAIVKIQSVFSFPNFLEPWTKHPQCMGSGSGVVIDGNRILTNAHNISNATYITVQKQDNSDPVTAKVEAVNHQCDLAILSVEDSSFFADITPFEIGETPPSQSQVLAIGYPMGGDGISVTQGIISRIEITTYVHSGVDDLLAAQIDAAINPGNSGGPIIYDGKVVGIAFQGTKGNGLGYMIHSDIIKHFLKDLQDGKVDGFGTLRIALDSLENPDTRRYFKMKPHHSGVRISKLKEVLGEDTRNLKVGDVILEVDGIKIMNNGNFIHTDGSNRSITTIIDSKQIGEKFPIKILRDGEEMELMVSPISRCCIVKPRIYNTTPSMFMIGGLVFTPLSISYVDEVSQENSYDRFTLLAEVDRSKKNPDDEIVVLCDTLGDEVNQPYQGASNLILEEVNGVKISNLKQLAELVDNMKDEFIVFKFKNDYSMILDLTKLKSANGRIIKNYALPSDRINLD